MTTAALADLLDQIYLLRSAAAYEASVIPDQLAFKGFPKSRRRFADEQIARLQGVARGHSGIAYASTSYLSLDHAARTFGLVAMDSYYDNADINTAVRELNLTRRGLAYEIVVLDAHVATTVPRAVTAISGGQTARLLNVLSNDPGTWIEAYRGLNTKAALIAAGAKQTLTLSQWLAESDL